MRCEADHALFDPTKALLRQTTTAAVIFTYAGGNTQRAWYPQVIC